MRFIPIKMCHQIKAFLFSLKRLIQKIIPEIINASDREEEIKVSFLIMSIFSSPRLLEHSKKNPTILIIKITPMAVRITLIIALFSFITILLIIDI